jgi:hypothetical protein
MNDVIEISPEEKEIYETFGFRWLEEKTVHRGRTHHLKLVMVLDTNNPHSHELKALAEHYDAYNQKRKYYEEMEFTTILLLFLLFIIPGILYIVYKLNQKKRFAEYNAEIEIQKGKLLEKAKPLLRY